MICDKSLGCLPDSGEGFMKGNKQVGMSEVKFCLEELVFCGLLVHLEHSRRCIISATLIIGAYMRLRCSCERPYIQRKGVSLALVMSFLSRTSPPSTSKNLKTEDRGAI